jgi:hypothetical protein
MVTSASRFFMRRIFLIDSIQLIRTDESLLFETILEINHKDICQNQHICFQYTCMREKHKGRVLSSKTCLFQRPALWYRYRQGPITLAMVSSSNSTSG